MVMANSPREGIKMMATGAGLSCRKQESIPDAIPGKGLGVGSRVSHYRVKDVSESKVGDTVTTKTLRQTNQLVDIASPSPWCSLGCTRLMGQTTRRYVKRENQLNDAALSYEPETSVALGFGPV